MEDSKEELRVVPELYFLIAKFLCGGPLKETAKTLLKELESIEVLPRRLDWEGREHAQSYDELASQYSEVSWRRLASVCERALHLAQLASPAAPAPSASPPALAEAPAAAAAAALAPAPAPAPGAQAPSERLAARLSLLSETLVRPKPKYASHKQDHTLVRRLVSRELGLGGAAAAGGAGGAALFPARLLGGLQLQRRTLGHLSAVYCLAFDCTGRYVFTGADDMLVKVWSAADGRLVATLRGAGAEITDVCATRDGALLACGSVDRLVRVWALAGGAPRAVLHAHQGTITSVHWAPPARADVRWLASTSTDCSVAFWTCSADGRFLSQPVQYVERMRPGVCHMICAAWSAGGAFLAAGSADHHVRVYTVEHEPGGPKRVLETAVHDDAVDSIAWAHRGLRFVSGSKDGSAALWTLHATQWRHVLLRPAPAHRDGKKLKMTMVCWDCSDAYVITAVSDNTIRVWCARTCTAVRSLSGHRDEAYVLEAHPFLRGVFLSAGHDGQLLVWDAAAARPLAAFHNRIDHHGHGAIFDAKWGGGATLAATDSHGHLLLLGLGAGHRLYSVLPQELFFHTDYRPVVVDALGGAHDEQTDTPPHLLPPPFLVDVEGAPHAPQFQRLVPGRENLALSQLIPATDAPPDAAAAAAAAVAAAAGVAGRESRGVWRGEGVRYTAGSWQRGDPLLVPFCSRPIVPPLPPAQRDRIHETCAELNALEQSWYRREMRRRPLMISTAGEGGGGARRRAGRRAGAARPAAPARPRARPRPAEPPAPDSASRSDTSQDEWQRAPSADSRASSLDLTDTTSSHSGSKSDSSSSSSSSSQYSDWEAGAALAPPARARRRPLPTRRYSPTVSTPKRAERVPAPAAASPEPAEPGPPEPGPSGAGAEPGAGAGPAPAPDELPDVYRPGEWLTAVSPRKAPYHPQMGDQCLYFRLGHQRYFEAVAEKDLYKVNPRDKPWERTHVYECELVKVVGIKYVIKPPRVACVRLACSLGWAGAGAGAGAGGSGAGAGRARSFTVRYHDMPDVIDFLVLRQQYDAAIARRWAPGDRFRCMIDDCWWTGAVVERGGAAGGGEAAAAAGGRLGGEAAREWAAEAAAHFLSLKVRWDNGEVERLSPWDLEPLEPARLPAQPGGAVPVLPAELEAVLYRAEPAEWPPRGDRAAACRAIAVHIGQVMTLSVAEPFVAPVDLQRYPQYARVVPYPVDLATIRARFQNLFYRRAAAAQFDVRYLASNAEQFNEPHSHIVRAARLLTDLLLRVIARWRELDVLQEYRSLAAAYRSSDDEPQQRRRHRGRRDGDEWRRECGAVLDELIASADAEPFRHPVSPEMAPDYARVVRSPMDLGTAAARLARGEYESAARLAADVRRVFANSRLYNTNKRSRIYSMTVRLSALFEALWSRTVARRPRRTRRARRAHRSPAPHRAARTRRAARAAAEGEEGAEAGDASSSDSEPLAAARRRERARARDSWDSDAPLRLHSKGKGVGKKSKSGSASADPAPGTSRAADRHDAREPPSNGEAEAEVEGEVEAEAEGEASEWELPGDAHDAHESHGSSAYSNIEVVEEELEDDDVELTYDDARTRRSASGARKRRAASSDGSRSSASSGSGSGGAGPRRPRRARVARRHKHKPLKRIRERFTDVSSSSSSSSGSWARGSGPGARGARAERAERGEASEGRRYESDHSYHPRYSTDDDAPLHLYRQRQEGGAGAGAGAGGEEAGPSGLARTHNGHDRRRGGGVSLRARQAQRRYNEDSEEDSIAAISKRLQHHHHPRHQLLHVARRRHHHAAQSATAESSAAHTADHNYFNGHAAHHNGTGGGGEAGAAAAGAGAGAGAARSGGSGASSGGAGPVSISSRGRVRKLTAKARGLLRD